MPTHFYIGLDLGQKVDHSALAIIDHDMQILKDRNPVTCEHLRVITRTVRYLEVLPLGMPYPDQVDHVESLVRELKLQGDVTLALDGGGVGGPVVDLFRRARLNCHLTPIILTGGINPGYSGSYSCVPRRELLSNLQVMLEHNRLQFATDLPAWQRLVREITGLRASNSIEPHDDLAFAVALAAWSCRKTADAPPLPSYTF